MSAAEFAQQQQYHQLQQQQQQPPQTGSQAVQYVDAQGRPVSYVYTGPIPSQVQQQQPQQMVMMPPRYQQQYNYPPQQQQQQMMRQPVLQPQQQQAQQQAPFVYAIQGPAGTQFVQQTMPRPAETGMVYPAEATQHQQQHMMHQQQVQPHPSEQQFMQQPPVGANAAVTGVDNNGAVTGRGPAEDAGAEAAADGEAEAEAEAEVTPLESLRARVAAAREHAAKRRYALKLARTGLVPVEGETDTTTVFLSTTTARPRESVTVVISGPAPSHGDDYVGIYRSNTTDCKRFLAIKSIPLDPTVVPGSPGPYIRQVVFYAPKAHGVYDFRVFDGPDEAEPPCGRSGPLMVSVQVRRAPLLHIRIFNHMF
jgi:hypothetical protein